MNKRKLTNRKITTRTCRDRDDAWCFRSIRLSIICGCSGLRAAKTVPIPGKTGVGGEGFCGGGGGIAGGKEDRDLSAE